MVDYKEVLRKYIDWVGYCEGVYYLEDKPYGLTDEEYEACKELIYIDETAI